MYETEEGNRIRAEYRALYNELVPLVDHLLSRYGFETSKRTELDYLSCLCGMEVWGRYDPEFRDAFNALPLELMGTYRWNSRGTEFATSENDPTRDPISGRPSDDYIDLTAYNSAWKKIYNGSKERNYALMIAIAHHGHETTPYYYIQLPSWSRYLPTDFEMAFRMLRLPSAPEHAYFRDFS